MKNTLPLIIVMLIFSTAVFAQVSFETQLQRMESRKQRGEALANDPILFNPNYHPPANKVSAAVSSHSGASCDCWLRRDTTWQVAQMDFAGGSGGPGTPPLFRNDDWSTGPIAFPFGFCFFDTTVNALYINNNGNVSLLSPVSTFSSDTFPNNTFTIIAPFWADVDTRGLESGVVYYKVTPTAVIIQWDEVGYYNSRDSSLNSFQLIITDGNDPLLANGNNVGFCYGDMQWTTGDASGGLGGFSTPTGIPATIGVNRGNGADYRQFGTFSMPGTTYDGPFNTPDGVDWLDGRSIEFSLCDGNASNVPPIFSSTDICDTILMCVGDSLTFHALYLSEPNQSATIDLIPGTMNGMSVINNSSGSVAEMEFSIHAVNTGFFNFQLQAIDNNIIPDTTTNNIVVRVNPDPVANATYSPSDTIIENTPVQFTSASSPGALHNWNFGDSTTSTLLNPVHTYTAPGIYTVTLNVFFPNLCSSTYSFTIEVLSDSVLTGITSHPMSNVNVYPNPANESLTVSGVNSPFGFELSDPAGRTILSSRAQMEEKIKLESLSPGIYLLRIHTESGARSFRVIKQ